MRPAPWEVRTDARQAATGGRAPLLQDKVAVVTGAAGGMGAASGRHFAQEGARVCLRDVRPVSALTRSLAVESGPHGVTVNAILPGAVATPVLSDFLADMGLDPDEVFTEVARSIPVGRAGPPSDIAGVALMLASDLSPFVSGIELIVDGAQHLPEWNG